MSEQLEERGRALENEYFHRKERELIEKMKAKLQTSETVDLNLNRIDRNGESRIVGRAEDEGKRCAGSNYRPVGRRVEPCPPDVRARDFAAIEMNDRRIEFGNGKFLRNFDKVGFRLFAACANFFGK